MGRYETVWGNMVCGALCVVCEKRCVVCSVRWVVNLMWSSGHAGGSSGTPGVSSEPSGVLWPALGPFLRSSGLSGVPLDPRVPGLSPGIPSGFPCDVRCVVCVWCVTCVAFRVRSV